MLKILAHALLMILLAPSISVWHSTLAIQTKPPEPKHKFRIRTITAGVNLSGPGDLKTIEAAIEFLQHARKKFEDEGYEIQTVRIATQPFSQYLNGKSRADAIADLKKIDDVLSARNVILSIGPVITADRHDPEFAAWATQLVKETKNISFSVTVASERGVRTERKAEAREGNRMVAHVGFHEVHRR